jgi:hypothetical protein
MSARELLRAGLPGLRAAAPGAVVLGRLLWHAQRAESAFGRGRFEECWDQLWRAGRLMSPHSPQAPAWGELVLCMLEACLRGALKAQLAETLEEFGWLAWSDDAQVWSAVALIEACEQAGTWSTGAHLGDLLARRWPASAVGPLMAGHFRELELLGAGEAGGVRHGAVAQRFERAMELAVQEGREADSLALRAGVALMLAGREKGRGRALLRGLKANALPSPARLWYAVGMARSDFWLDRVRAADVIGEEAALLDERDVVGRQALIRLLRFVMTQDALVMQSAEEDRLDALIGELAEGDERALLRDLLRLRALITAQGAGTPAQAPEVAAQLAQMSATHGGAWRGVAATYRSLAALTDEATSPDQLALPREEAWRGLEVARIAEELVYAARTGGLAGAIGAAQYATGALESKIGHARPAELRPLGAAWPALLALCEGRAADEAQAEQRAHLAGLVGRLFVAWAERAPSPASGWWQLSAHLARAGMLEAAERAAERAWGAGEAGDEVARGYASGQLLAWVIEQGEPARMLKWLERMEPKPEASGAAQ